MTEYNKLKEIIETIEFDSNFIFRDEEYHFRYGSCNSCTRAEAEEIIFNSDFIKAYRDYFINYDNERVDGIMLGLLNNLDNMVDYIYQTLEIDD